jgi:hypothetical protein
MSEITQHQITGEPIKFLSIADRTGIMETGLFAQIYKKLWARDGALSGVGD